MAFAQLTYRESLRDIEVCHAGPAAQALSLGHSEHGVAQHAGQRKQAARLAYLRRCRPGVDSHCTADVRGEDLGLDLDNTVFALDASTVDLCLSVFPWAPFRSTKAAIKLHTLLDLRGPIPTFLHVSDGKMADVHALDRFIPEPGAFYVMDRAYLDFERLHALAAFGAFFVIRAKSNTRYHRRYSQPVDKTTGLRCDQTIVLTGADSTSRYPQPLRRVKYWDESTGKTFNFLTNNFAIPALTVAELYRYRWQVELFFKWIKQHLRIKSFFGTSENAVKSQIWIAVSVYVLLAILKKRLDLPVSLYTILQTLSLTAFEKTPLLRLFSETDYTSHSDDARNLLPSYWTNSWDTSEWERLPALIHQAEQELVFAFTGRPANRSRHRGARDHRPDRGARLWSAKRLIASTNARVIGAISADDGHCGAADRAEEVRRTRRPLQHRHVDVEVQPVDALEGQRRVTATRSRRRIVVPSWLGLRSDGLPIGQSMATAATVRP